MIDNIKIINFIQDFGCIRLDQLQKLLSEKNNNFNNLLNNRLVSKKGNIFVHNTSKIDNDMLVALDILCKYKGRYKQFHTNYEPIKITFLSKDNLLYHIIVANEENKKAVIKFVNSYPLSMNKADKLILAFPNKEDVSEIDCDIPFLYCVYPELTIINSI